MALPIVQMPTGIEFTMGKFRLTPFTTQTTVRSGKTFGTQIAPQVWEVSISTRPLYLNELGKFQAFLDQQRGGMGACLLFNPARRLPFTYRKTGLPGGFDGEALLQNYIDERTIYIENLPVGFILVPGDLIGLIQNGRYSLHRVQGTFTADGSGIAANVKVEPAISEFFDEVDTTVMVANAEGEFLIDADSIQGDEETAAPTSLNFSAMSRAF